MESLRFLFRRAHLMLLAAGCIPGTVTYGNFSNVLFSTSGSVNAKYEISFSYTAHANPYDPAVLDIYAFFTSPSGQVYKVNAFYHEPFSAGDVACPPNSWPGGCVGDPLTNAVLNNIPCETLTSQGAGSWRVRFSPNVTGAWKFRLVANDLDHATMYYSPPNPTMIFPWPTWNFSVTASTVPGAIKLANKRFLTRGDGKLFFPVGSNMAWYGRPCWRGTSEYGTNEYDHYFTRMHGRTNTIRVWLDDFESFALVGRDYRTNQMQTYMNQRSAYQLDKVFERARTENVAIQLTLFAAGSWGDCAYGDDNWSNNNAFKLPGNSPMGCINTPFELFTATAAKTRTKNLLRYIVARYGYSTDLLAWEFWNEVDQVVPTMNTPQHPGDCTGLTAPGSFWTDVKNWHVEMSTYVRSVDVHKHLITSSGWPGPERPGETAPGFAGCLDMVQKHDYKGDNPGWVEDSFQAHVKGVCEDWIGYYDKPFIMGEWGWAGNVWMGADDHGVDLHNTLWSSAFSASAGSAYPWYWDDDIDLKNTWPLFKPVKDFMNALPVLSDRFDATFVQNQNCIRSNYIWNGVDSILGWMQDKNFHLWKLYQSYPNYLATLAQADRPGACSGNNNFSFPVPADGSQQYSVKWYNPVTGALYSTQNVNASGGTLNVSMPTALRTGVFGDAVFVIVRNCAPIWRRGALMAGGPMNVGGPLVSKHGTGGEVFYRAPNNELHSYWFVPGVEEWVHLHYGQVGATVQSDLLMSVGSGAVFYRSTTNTLRGLVYSSGAWNASTMNNVATDVGGVMAISPTDEIFYRSTAGKLKGVSWNSGTSTASAITAVNNLQVTVATGGLAVSADGTRVFHVSSNGGLSSIVRNGTWQVDALGGAIGGNNNNIMGPIVRAVDGVVYLRTNGRPYRAALVNDVWQETGPLAAASMSGLTSNDQGDVFMRTNSGALVGLLYSNGTYTYSTLGNAGTTGVSPPMAADDLGSVFFRTTTGDMERIYFRSACFTTPSPEFKRQDAPDESTERLNSVATILLVPNPASTFVRVVGLDDGRQIRSARIWSNGALVGDLRMNGWEADIAYLTTGFYIVELQLSDGNTMHLRLIRT